MEQWLDGDHAVIAVTTRDGKPYLRMSVERAHLTGRLTGDGELVRFSYQPLPDPEFPDAPPEPRRNVRLVLEDVPPPSLNGGDPEAQGSSRRPLGPGPEPTADSGQRGPWDALGPFNQYETQAHGPGGPGL